MKKEELKEIIVESVLEALYRFTNLGVMMMSSSQEGDEGDEGDEDDNPPDTIPSTPTPPPPDTIPENPNPRPGPITGTAGY